MRWWCCGAGGGAEAALGAVLAAALVAGLCAPPACACGPGRGGGRRRSPRKLTPMVFLQYIPNVPEQTLSASGLTDGKLTRSSPKFNLLVPNYNNDIIFKDEEGDGSDRIMTQRLKVKLDTLAISVMNQWPGVRLRVTEAWDESGLHAPDSLHYSARAVDVTTSDRDRSKLGMLARLAIEAGFDWVFYESRSHIHISVKSEESADAARSGGCFDGNARVRTPDGPRTMSELAVGDRVLVSGPDGSLDFSEVILFLDRDESGSRVYRTIETESGASITLTPSHLIFAAAPDSNRTVAVERGAATFARDVEPGHYVFVRQSSDGRIGHVAPERVIRVSLKRAAGVFAPLTREGNVVVNNVVVSCYAVLHHQTLAHLAFLPFRIADNLKLAATHFLKKFAFVQLRTPKRAVQDKGIHWYPRLLYAVTHYLLPEEYLYH